MWGFADVLPLSDEISSPSGRKTNSERTSGAEMTQNALIESIAHNS